MYDYILKEKASAGDTTLKASQFSKNPAALFLLHCAGKYNTGEAVIFCASIGDIVKEYQKWYNKRSLRQEHICYAYLFLLPECTHFANLVIRDDRGVDVVPAPKDSKVHPHKRHHKSAFMRKIFGQ